MQNPDALQLFELFLRRKGLYNTVSRQQITAAVCAQSEPFDAAQIWVLLGTRQVGLSTIYRTLELLDEAGLIRRMAGEVTRYECVFQRQWHEYLRCDACGKWTPFSSEAVDAQLTEIAQQLGFSVRARSLVLQGICRECKLKSAAQAAATPTW